MYYHFNMFSLTLKNKICVKNIYSPYNIKYYSIKFTSMQIFFLIHTLPTLCLEQIHLSGLGNRGFE